MGGLSTRGRANATLQAAAVDRRDQLGVERDDAVPAAALGRIDRNVGALEQPVDRVAELPLAYPEAAGQLQRCFSVCRRMAEIRARSSSDAKGGGEIAALEQHGEFLAPQPAGDGFFAGYFPGDPANGLVAYVVPVHVIDALEMVDVHHDGAERLAAPADLLRFRRTPGD